ncbi:MAG: hypothetical protein CMJ78_27760 [Planctomycetaceae bacterium]|nr:hypothetical protein [Planctomycetaceae bacterium]
MDFDKRLERAIERGQRSKDAESRAAAEKAMTEEDLRNLHSKCRLEMTEHIENCLQQVSDHFPGFEYKTVVDEKGWGGRVIRDDLGFSGQRKPENFYSRLEMVVRPFSSTHIIELAAKSTIRNKEAFNRTHFQFLSEADMDSFSELIDLWVLEFAEKYSAQT